MLASRRSHPRRPVMSHLTHPKVQTSHHIKSHRLFAIAALLALVATAAVVLALALAGNSPTSSTAETPQAALRVDGGPEESSLAAAIGSQPSAAGPDESNIAVAIGSGREAPSAAS